MCTKKEKNHACIGKEGKPLKNHRTVNEAREEVDYVKNRYGKNMEPYHCHKCGFWHLTPKDRHTPSVHCDACDKELYETKEGAERRAEIIGEENGTRLRVYPCPHGGGWHLTSSPSRNGY